MADEPQKDEKTEEATPRAREEARERGQVAQSQEFVAAVMLLFGALGLVLGGGELANALGQIIEQTMRALATVPTMDLGPAPAAALLQANVENVLGPFLAVIVPAVVVGGLIAYGQVGFRIAPKAVEPKLNKLDPIQGAKKMFSLRSVFRTGMSLAKIFVIATSMIVVAWWQLPTVIDLAGNDLGPVLVGVGRVALMAVSAALIAILALSVADLTYQRFQYGVDLRMTKQQVKEEHKNSEGDPHIKSKVRQIQRETARRRMMSEVPDATVVVTNPTHYAVALRYTRGEGGEPVTAAPVVVAKGVDAVAQRIKQIATDSGVMLYEDVPLARSLHAQCEIGQLVPEELYAAVAAVLRYVYEVQGARPTAAAAQ
jgi:flagellar biosynthetic protein FlhB